MDLITKLCTFFFIQSLSINVVSRSKDAKIAKCTGHCPTPEQAPFTICQSQTFVSSNSLLKAARDSSEASCVRNKTCHDTKWYDDLILILNCFLIFQSKRRNAGNVQLQTFAMDPVLQLERVPQCWVEFQYLIHSELIWFRTSHRMHLPEVQLCFQSQTLCLSKHANAPLVCIPSDPFPWQMQVTKRGATGER